MKQTWEVDDATVVSFETGFLRNTLTAYGQHLPSRISLRKKSDTSFILKDGRRATFSVRPQFATAAAAELRVDGQLMVETGKEPLKCGACGTTVKPNDRFCLSCGHAMPPAEDHVHRKNLKRATNVIWTLAGLFLIFGIVMFFVAKSQTTDVLLKLAHMNPDATIPTPIGGKTYTVAALRSYLLWQPWGVLFVNLVLAAVMAILALWGRRAPLAALLVATATYAVVIVTNAIVDPRTIAQGIFLKIVVVALLIRGIKAALALRVSNA